MNNNSPCNKRIINMVTEVRDKQVILQIINTLSTYLSLFVSPTAKARPIQTPSTSIMKF